MKKRKIVNKWVIYGLIAFFAYFFVNTLLKVLSNEDPYLVSMLLYLASAMFMFFFLDRHFKIKLSKKNIWICVCMGIFSVLSTIFSLKALQLAPNPGYAVAIFSSNYVIIALISPFIFKSRLNVKKVGGIFATLLGLILVSIEGEFVFKKWLIFAFLAFLCIAIVNLLQKFVAKADPYSASFVKNLSAFVIVFIGLIKKGKFELLSNAGIVASIAGFFSGIGSVYALKSIKKSPNPGYSIAIYSSNYVLLTFVSLYIFASSISSLKVIGIIATLIGLFLLSV